MPPMAIVGDYSALSLSWAGKDREMEVGRHSPVVGYNPHPVPKSEYPRKDLIGEDLDGSEVLC